MKRFKISFSMGEALLSLLFFLALAALWATPVQAQTMLPVSSGVATGSYYRFINEAKGVCADQVMIKNDVSTGSPQNLDRLENNEVSVVPVQLDVLSLYANTKDMSNVKVLLPLFPEQLHFVTRANLGQKEGGYGIGNFKIGQKDVILNTVEDLAGKVVAAAGGSYYTIQVVKLQANLPMQLVEASDADAVVAGVLSGKYDAGLLVGAQPLGTLVKMGPKMAELKLLPVTDKIANDLSKVYSKADALTYRAMGQGGANIRAVQVTSALVTQNYRKGGLAEAVYKLRRCIWDHAQEQAGTPGTHPAWRNVKSDGTSNWPMWDYQPVGLNQVPVKKK